MGIFISFFSTTSLVKSSSGTFGISVVNNLTGAFFFAYQQAINLEESNVVLILPVKGTQKEEHPVHYEVQVYAEHHYGSQLVKSIYCSSFGAEDESSVHGGRPCYECNQLYPVVFLQFVRLQSFLKSDE